MASPLLASSNRAALRVPTERGPVREFLAISLAGQLYGIELVQIQEIPESTAPHARATSTPIRPRNM